MPKPVRESAKLTEAASTTDAASGRLSIQVISPGWGGSGYYSREVCESAAPLVTVGTQMFMDHPHQDGSGVDERGNRSVRDIAAVITEEGRWDPNAGESGAVVAEAQVVGHYRDILLNEHLAASIGLSIRGSATDVAIGEAEGRSGPIIESLATIDSVDFVTRAGRGGRITKVLESARDTAPDLVLRRALGHGVEEATADERRQQLSDAVRATYGAEDRWVWVRDFDDAVVWFEISSENEATHTWEQAYTVADDDLGASLTGARTHVRPVTKYVPATRPDSTTTTTESQEDTMPKIQVEESVHTDALAKAGRVDALEAENVALKEDAARRARHDRATELVAEALAAETAAGVTFTPLEQVGLLAQMPVKEGALDEDAFTKTVTEAITAKKAGVTESTAPAAPGAAPVTGFGSYVGQPGTSTTESTTPTRSPWGRELTGA